MKAFAPQSADKDTFSPRHRAVLKQSLPGPVAFPPTSHSEGVFLQRKANCACGGGCPSCAEEATAKTIQTKLTVSQPGDQYEQEADRVAEQIFRLPQSSIQPDQPRSDIQRISTGGAHAVKDAPDIKLSQSGGRPLSPSARQFMEPRFGAEFGHVRVHTDHEAHETASQIQARAFTHGHHIWFGKGQSEQDVPLLAHELTHVVQQGAAGPAEHASPVGVKNNAAGSQIQRDRLPCTTRTTLDVFGVNIGGATRTLVDDLAVANSVLCQCGISLNVTGGQSDQTNIVDLDAPLGALNPSGGTPSRELSEMVNIRPGGPVIHVYYVPAIPGRRGESIGSTRFTPALPDSVIVSQTAVADTFVHELVHVLLNSGNHHTNPNNLMADGSVRNVGVDELEQTQCNSMP